MTAHRRHSRTIAAIFALFALTIFAGAAHARTASGVRFASIPRRFAQHDLVNVAVAVRSSNVLCSLSIRYADGRGQDGLRPVVPISGRAKWRFRIPDDAAPGRARVTASCESAGSVRRSVLVVGTEIPARIVVVKDGYSIRSQQFGSSVSYGIILQNASPNEDALQVYALVNFVGPDNKLVGSATTTVPGIPASQQFALGGELQFPGAVPPIARLEIVVQIQKRQRHALKFPTITNVVVAPSVFEPAWVGAVEGEVSNDQSSLELQNAQLSTVILDAAGNVIGGGSGFAFASLPPAAREFFKIEQGLRSIPFGNAASAMVSAVGTYVGPNGIPVR